MQSPVVILGAGFSRALSARMPLTDELGQLVLAALPDSRAGDQAPAFSTRGLTFETWLSWLATRQPYETEGEFFNNQGHFSEIQSVIGEVLRSAQTEAEADLPSWFGALVDILHNSQAGVITMNYDTLVESAFGRKAYTDGAGHSLSQQDIVAGFPNGSGVFQAGYHGFWQRPTFRLHKLHGSVDWYSLPGDPTGGTLERIQTPTDGREDRDMAAWIGGRSEFIVPPTSSKSEYFDNPTTRFIWRQSFEKLRTADRVILVGYSLPTTDTAIASMISRALEASESTVTVVDPRATDVQERLVALGIRPDRIELVDGRDSVAQFVARESEAASANLLNQLRDTTAARSSSPLAVGWNYSTVAPVRSVGHNPNGDVVLRVDGFASIGELVHPRVAALDDRSATRVAVAADLVAEGASSGTLVVTDGHSEWFVGSELEGVLPASDDALADRWLALRPLGDAPKV